MQEKEMTTASRSSVQRVLQESFPHMLLKGVSEDPMGFKVVYVHNAPEAPTKEAVKSVLRLAFGDALVFKTPTVISQKFAQ